jgi:hypothetical protein
MVDPRSFFTALAAFEPYNQHFIQDIGAFQIGLGAVLLLAGVWCYSASSSRSSACPSRARPRSSTRAG